MARLNQREDGVSWFSKVVAGNPAATAELPDIYPLSLELAVFTKADILATYTKILTDTLERTHGLPPKLYPLLWDNCVLTGSQDGLVTMLALAMFDKSELFLVYKSGVKVIRRATAEEKTKIKADYETAGESPLGVYVSFKNYRRTDMLLIYSALEYCVLASLHKTVNLSKAVQIKMDSLRASVSLADSGIATAQAQSIADALTRGRSVLLDAKDAIETATPDVGPTEKAIAFLDAKRAYILGLPLSYISGLQVNGLNATGEADMRAVERGLKQYFVSIIHPVLQALFDVDTEFLSQDFRFVTSALDVLKTFDLVDGTDLLSRKSQQEILSRVFDLDPVAEAKALADEEKERVAEKKLAPVPPTFGANVPPTRAV